jgi:hypothetical protein
MQGASERGIEREGDGEREGRRERERECQEKLVVA